jgi:hypothetical protein
MEQSRLSVVFVAALALSGCDDSGKYTLYRNSPDYPDMRIHVAIFDASDADRYNGENCRIASELFVNQPRVKVRYWCEKGRYRS